MVQYNRTKVVPESAVSLRWLNWYLNRSLVVKGRLLRERYNSITKASELRKHSTNIGIAEEKHWYFTELGSLLGAGQGRGLLVKRQHERLGGEEEIGGLGSDRFQADAHDH